jgi:hypothetical protein
LLTGQEVRRGSTFSLDEVLHMSVANVSGKATSVPSSTVMGERPPSTEVNARLENQADRIQDGFDQGELTASQAKDLHGEDKAIRHEEKEMASLDGGLSQADKTALNQQLDTVSKQIYAQRHGGETA